MQKRHLISQFCYQANTNLNSLHEASSLVIPAELTDWVDDLIHLPQGHAIHLPVQLVEVFLDLFVVIGIVLVVALVEHGSDRLAIAVVRRVLFYVCLQGFNELFHNITVLLRFG